MRGGLANGLIAVRPTLPRKSRALSYQIFGCSPEPSIWNQSGRKSTFASLSSGRGTSIERDMTAARTTAEGWASASVRASTFRPSEVRGS